MAHNVYVARGREAGGEGEQLDHVRIFVWARNNVVGAKAGGPLNTYSTVPVQLLIPRYVPTTYRSYIGYLPVPT